MIKIKYFKVTALPIQKFNHTFNVVVSVSYSMNLVTPHTGGWEWGVPSSLVPRLPGLEDWVMDAVVFN